MNMRFENKCLAAFLVPVVLLLPLLVNWVSLEMTVTKHQKTRIMISLVLIPANFVLAVVFMPHCQHQPQLNSTNKLGWVKIRQNICLLYVGHSRCYTTPQLQQEYAQGKEMPNRAYNDDACNSA